MKRLRNVTKGIWIYQPSDEPEEIRFMMTMKSLLEREFPNETFEIQNYGQLELFES